MHNYGPPKPRSRIPAWAEAAVWCCGAALSILMLLGMLLPRVQWSPGPRRSQISAAITQIGAFKTALRHYTVHNGQPPTTGQGLRALVERPSISPLPRRWLHYLSDVKAIPPDPWGNPFLYQSPGPGGEAFLITCLGADGRPGGTGDAADITSAQ